MKTIKFKRDEQDYLSAQVGSIEVKFLYDLTGVDLKIFVWGKTTEQLCNVKECKHEGTEKCIWSTCRKTATYDDVDDSLLTGDFYSCMAKDQNMPDWETNPLTKVKLVKGLIISILNNTDNIMPPDGKTEYPKKYKKIFMKVPWEAEGVIF